MTNSRARTYLMCRPTHFRVEYSINPWMDPSVAVDVERACAEWEQLRELYREYGHTVYELTPDPELPDMVFSANGAFSVEGRVYGAHFAYPQRTREAEHHAQWYTEHTDALHFTPPTHVNEGEGDFTYVPAHGLILAGYGFRTTPSAHTEAQATLQKPVISLHLVDERFYHLDVALFVLDDTTVCYYPGAFSGDSQRVLETLFPDAVIAQEKDAVTFGLNAVSDGHNVFLPTEAQSLATQLREREYNVIPVDLSELLKGGGSIKCCTAEIRTAPH